MFNIYLGKSVLLKPDKEYSISFKWYFPEKDLLTKYGYKGLQETEQFYFYNVTQFPSGFTSNKTDVDFGHFPSFLFYSPQLNI